MKESLKDLMYAGLGLIESSKNYYSESVQNKAKEEFLKLVETGKKADSEGKHLIEDFFNSINEGKAKAIEKAEELIDKQKSKL